MIEDIKEYKLVIEDKQVEISDLKTMYYEMEEKANQLEKELANTNNNEVVKGLEAELKKANEEVENHRQEMERILNTEAFEEVN